MEPGGSRRSVFRGRVFELTVERIRLPHGAEATVEAIRHPGAAAIVPLLDDRRVALIRQYRPVVGRWLLEVPAGTLEPGEAHEACARREVEEESGWRAAHLEPLGAVYTAPGFTDESISLWLARGLVPGDRHLDADECLEVELVPLQEALRRARSGEIEDAKTICALFRAAHMLG